MEQYLIRFKTRKDYLCVFESHCYIKSEPSENKFATLLLDYCKKLASGFGWESSLFGADSVSDFEILGWRPTKFVSTVAILQKYGFCLHKTKRKQKRKKKEEVEFVDWVNPSYLLTSYYFEN